MTVGAIVLEEKSNGRRFRLTRLLGSGYIGAVYEGVSDANTSDGEAKIAVKLPYANLSNDLNQRFWEEERVLARLYQRSGGRYVPNAWHGTLVDSNGPVLCMDLVRGKRLTDFFDPTKHRLPEALALESAVQYAALLTCLQEERISCADRKVSDIYWNAAARQLTVLDWNVIDTGDKFRPGDNIATFGRLWFELLTGSLPPALDERGRLEQNPYWHELSLGTRTIVGKALAPSQASYQAAKKLENDFQTHWQDFNLEPPKLVQKTLSALKTAETDRDEIVRAVKVLNDVTRQAVQVDAVKKACIDFEQELTNTQRLVDLVERLAGSEAEVSQVRSLNQALKSVIGELLSEAHQMLDVRRDPEGALQWVRRATWLAEEGDAEKLLLIQRWQVLAEAGQAGLQANPTIQLSGYLTDLVGLVTALAQGEWDNASTQWQKLRERLRRAEQLDTPVGRLLTYLGEESELRRQVVTAQGESERRAYADATAHYEAIQTSLNQLAGKHPYWAVLRKVIEESSDLTARIAWLKQKSKPNGGEDFLKQVDDALEKTDYRGALVLLNNQREQERMLGGVPLSETNRTRPEQARQFVELLNLLVDDMHEQRWDVLLAPETGILDQLRRLAQPGQLGALGGADQPANVLSAVSQQALRKLVHQFWETLLSTLQESYTRGDDPWQQVTKESQARMLCGLLEQLQHWVPPAVEPTSIGARALASPGATSAEGAVEVNARWTWIQPLLDGNRGTTIEQRALLQMAVTNLPKLQQRRDHMIVLRQRYFDSQDEHERQQVLREADNLSIEIIEGHPNNAIRQANVLVDLGRQLPNEDALATFLDKLSQLNINLTELAQSRHGLDKDLDTASRLRQELDELTWKREETAKNLKNIETDLATHRENAQLVSRQRTLIRAQQTLQELNGLDAVKYEAVASKELSLIRDFLNEVGSLAIGEPLMMHQVKTDLAQAEKEWQTWRKLAATWPSATPSYNVSDYPDRSITPTQFAERVVSATRQTETVLSPNSKEFVDWLQKQNQSDLPGCLRRLLQQTSNVSSVASQFEADHLRWWQEWRQWAAKSTRPPANRIREKQNWMRELRSAIEKSASHHQMQQANTLIQRELLIGWLQRIQAAEHLAQVIEKALRFLDQSPDKKRLDLARLEALLDRFNLLYSVMPSEVLGLFAAELGEIELTLQSPAQPKQSVPTQIGLPSDLKMKLDMWQTMQAWF